MSARPDRSSGASRRYHDRVAGRYDDIYDGPYWRFHDELTWRAIKPHIPSRADARCADLGCGTGKWGLRLLKSGLATVFVDSSAAMVDQARARAEALGPKARRAEFLVADIIDLGQLPSGEFSLLVAMGDPLSICSDPAAAAREMFRLLRPGGVVIATADNKLAGLEHYVQRGDLDALEQFVRTGRAQWLTEDPGERFDLQTFTPESLRRLFEQAGFELLELTGKTILPLRKWPSLLDAPGAMDRLLKLELSLGRQPGAAAAAGHLQITARRP